jgi:hypothetical protein
MKTEKEINKKFKIINAFLNDFHKALSQEKNKDARIRLDLIIRKYEGYIKAIKWILENKK